MKNIAMDTIPPIIPVEYPIYMDINIADKLAPTDTINPGSVSNIAPLLTFEKPAKYEISDPPTTHA